MKRRTPLLFVALLVGCSLCCSCHKVCTCIGYDAMETEFTVEEVDAHASGNCTEMRDFPIENRYSYCHW